MNQKLGFTFVELIVVVAIIGILSTLGFISYTSSLWDARDSTRKSDSASISSALKQYKQSRWSYPIPSPGDNFYINIGVAWTNTGALQWTLNNKVTISTLDNIPQDPKADLYYSYSVTPNRQEYQIAATLENNDTPLSILQWDYTSVSKIRLPTIMLATGSTSSIDVVLYPDLFIFDNQIHNLSYDFTWDNIPVIDGTTTNYLLIEADASGSWWQNTDYQNCSEITEANKMTWSWEYQVVDPSDWTLGNTTC